MGLLSSGVHGLSLPVISLVVEHSPDMWASVAVAHGLTCPTECGIFLDQVELISPALAGGYTQTIREAQCIILI